MLLSEWHHTGPWTWRRMKWPQTPQPALKQFGFFVVQKENNKRDNNRCRSRDDMFHSQAFIKKRVSEQQSVSTLKIIFPSNLPLSSTSVPAFIYLYKWTPQIVCLLASNNQSDLQRVSVHCSLHFMKLPSLSTDQVSNSLSILYIINNHLINYPSIVCVMLSDFTLMGRETVLSKKKEEEGSWWLIGSICEDKICFSEGDEIQLCDLFLTVETIPVPVLYRRVFHHDERIRVLSGQRRRSVGVLRQRAAEPKLWPRTKLLCTRRPRGAGIHLQRKYLLKLDEEVNLCNMKPKWTK